MNAIIVISDFVCRIIFHGLIRMMINLLQYIRIFFSFNCTNNYCSELSERCDDDSINYELNQTSETAGWKVFGLRALGRPRSTLTNNNVLSGEALKDTGS